MTRSDLLAALAQAGRANSDATVWFHASVATRLGLHPTDYKVLGLVLKDGPTHPGALAAHTGLTPASMTSVVDRLVARGFVTRRHDEADRRRVVVEARHVPEADALFAPAVADLEAMWERYTDAELTVILDFLSRNAERLAQHTARVERA